MSLIEISIWLKHDFVLGGDTRGGRRFSSRILRYIYPSIGISIQWSNPVLLAEKQPESTMIPPPGLTMGVVFIAPDTTGRVDDKELDLRFLQNFPFNHLDVFSGRFKTGLYMVFLKQGHLVWYQGGITGEC